MNTKHTPGPWDVSRPLSPDHPWISARCNHDRAPDGSEFYMSVSGLCNEADARLIAAAPEMLEAIRFARNELMLVRDGHTGGVPNSIVALIPEAIERIDAAIAAATGED